MPTPDPDPGDRVPSSSVIDRTTLIDVVFPASANHYGTLFGGRALELLGRAAFVGATRAVRRRLVMASCNEVKFLSPVHTGEIIELVATVRLTRTRSLTVDVAVEAEDLLTGVRRPAVRGSFDMVAVDQHGRPEPLDVPNTRRSAAVADPHPNTEHSGVAP